MKQVVKGDVMGYGNVFRCLLKGCPGQGYYVLYWKGAMEDSRFILHRWSLIGERHEGSMLQESGLSNWRLELSRERISLARVNELISVQTQQLKEI